MTTFNTNRNNKDISEAANRHYFRASSAGMHLQNFVGRRGIVRTWNTAPLSEKGDIKWEFIIFVFSRRRTFMFKELNGC